MENSKTKIKKIKEPDFSKEVTITKLIASKENIDFHFKEMKKALGDKANDQVIWTRINSLVLRDNVFNEAMHILIPCYEITIDPEQIKGLAEFFKKNNPGLEKAPEQYLINLARTTIEKQLIFNCIAKENNITVSDDEAKTSLEAYYKASNNPIRDILSNPKAMEGVKATILEQKIADFVCKKLKWKADWEAIRKYAEAKNANAPKKEEKGDGTIIEK